MYFSLFFFVFLFYRSPFAFFLYLPLLLSDDPTNYYKQASRKKIFSLCGGAGKFAIATVLPPSSFLCFLNIFRWLATTETVISFPYAASPRSNNTVEDRPFSPSLAPRQLVG